MDEKTKIVAYLQTGETDSRSSAFSAVFSALESLTSLERGIIRLKLNQLDAINPSTNLIDKKLTTAQERALKMREHDLEMVTHLLYKESDIEIEITMIFAAVIAGSMAKSRPLIRRMLIKRAGHLSKAYVDFVEESRKWGQTPHEGNAQSIYYLIQCVQQAVNERNTQPVIDFVEQRGVDWIRSLLKNWTEQPPHTKKSIAIAKRFYEIWDAGKKDGLKQPQAMRQALIELGYPTDETKAEIESLIRLSREVKTKLGF